MCRPLGGNGGAAPGADPVDRTQDGAPSSGLALQAQAPGMLIPSVSGESSAGDFNPPALSVPRAAAHRRIQRQRGQASPRQLQLSWALLRSPPDHP